MTVQTSDGSSTVGDVHASDEGITVTVVALMATEAVMFALPDGSATSGASVIVLVVQTSNNSDDSQ